MRIVITTMIFLIACIISGASQASTYNSEVRDLYSEKLIEAMVRDQKERHIKKFNDEVVVIKETTESLRSNKQYIFKDNPAAADREYVQLVKNLDYNKEIYVGR